MANTKKNTKKSAATTPAENPTQTANGKQIVGSPTDVSRFTVGDLVQMHLEYKNQIFDESPHGDVGTVHALHHEDETHYYNMPVILFPDGLKMVNPEFLIVTQYMTPRAGQDGETARMAAAAAAIAANIEKLKAAASTDDPA